MKKMKLIRSINNYVIDKKFSIVYKNDYLDIINYTKMLDFSDTIIKISHNDKVYVVEGTNLVISKMLEEEILITGNIDSISFK